MKVRQWAPMSVVLAISSADPVERRWAVDLLVTAYWKPAYKYIRTKWRLAHEAARTFTQAFLSQAIDNKFFRSFDPATSTVRAFVRTAIDRFMDDSREFISRISHWNELPFPALDFEAAQYELREPALKNSEEYFEREWVHSLFAMAIDALERECGMHGRAMDFHIFERADLQGQTVSIEDLAVEFRLAPQDLADYLSRVRRQLRTILLENLKLLTGSDHEYRTEARILIGLDLA
jgi:hypothetical protein